MPFTFLFRVCMARHYYLTRAGRLRRKDNTLCFEPSARVETEGGSAREREADDEVETTNGDFDEEGGEIGSAGDGLGELHLDPIALESAENKPEAGEHPDDEAEAPVKVRDARVIPVEDVDAVWAFGELDINSRALIFLAKHRVPVHFFNFYGFYAGSFYPREYLHAGYLVVRQVRHYSNRRLRIAIAREFVYAALYNILRNLRYYAGRGICLQAETETVQAEIMRLEAVTDINELMSCEGRARAAYYAGFARILRNDVDFTRRVRHPPDNIVNALISFTNGLVYSAALTQIYRTQLDPTISFLHEPGARRFSLALDLAEVFKPILADRLLFKLLNNRQLSARDFAQDLNCCYLKESGKKTVLREWDARLSTTIEHRRLRRKVSYERLIRLECYKLVKHLTGVEPYKGFRAWW